MIAGGVGGGRVWHLKRAGDVALASNPAVIESKLRRLRRCESGAPAHQPRRTGVAAEAVEGDVPRGAWRTAAPCP